MTLWQGTAKLNCPRTGSFFCLLELLDDIVGYKTLRNTWGSSFKSTNHDLMCKYFTSVSAELYMSIFFRLFSCEKPKFLQHICLVMDAHSLRHFCMYQSHSVITRMWPDRCSYKGHAKGMSPVREKSTRSFCFQLFLSLSPVNVNTWYSKVADKTSQISCPAHYGAKTLAHLKETFT